jgi:hypothetical protein
MAVFRSLSLSAVPSVSFGESSIARDIPILLQQLKRALASGIQYVRTALQSPAASIGQSRNARAAQNRDTLCHFDFDRSCPCLCFQSLLPLFPPVQILHADVPEILNFFA